MDPDRKNRGDRMNRTEKVKHNSSFVRYKDLTFN